MAAVRRCRRDDSEGARQGEGEFVFTIRLHVRSTPRLWARGAFVIETSRWAGRIRKNLHGFLRRIPHMRLIAAMDRSIRSAWLGHCEITAGSAI